jgi:PAS domain S-box-containing protein
LQFTASDLHDLALLRMANISLEHGSCDGSTYAYARLMQVLGARFADHHTAFQFGQLACDLVDRRGLDRFKARVYMCFGIYVVCWFRHLATSRVWITRALDAANASGDLTFALYASKHLTTNLLVSGEALRDVEREIERGLAFARRARFVLVIDAFVGQLIMIRSLRGLQMSAVTPDNDEQGEDWFVQHLAQSPHLALPTCWYWIYKLQTCFFAGDHIGGLAAAAKAERLLGYLRAYIELAEYHFYAALIRAAACDAAPVDSKYLHLAALYDHHRQIMDWAKSCPANFANRVALVGAEIARIEGRELDAERLYEQAILSAREHGFIQNEGISHELAGRFYALRGFETIGDTYLRNARSCYLRWGADGKVSQLDRLYPRLRDTAIIGSPTTNFGARVEQLDIGTVLKAAQAVSGEIVLDQLIKTLLRIAIEHAGAERGLLILFADDEPLIAAEAITGGGQVEVMLRQTAVSSFELPESVLHYAIRTRESVILDDATAQNPFSADEHLRQKQVRSVLCLPLVKQTKLIGALYLENNFASHVFTPARISVLELLASQAAISLENARLYRDLQEREARIRRLVDSNIIGVVIWDIRGRIIEANRAFLDIVGYSREDLDSGRLRWTELTPAEWRDADERAMAELKAVGTVQPREKEYFHKNGSRVPVLLGSTTFGDRHDKGVAFVLDLRERKHAEQALRNAQTNLAQVMRVTLLGELTASIAHEVNQPITATIGNAEATLLWLRRRPPDLDEARQLLARIVKDGHRALNVVGRIRDLIKKAPARIEHLEINAVISEVLEFTRGETMKHSISVQTRLSEGLPLIRADRTQLQQVILNLIVNAVQALSQDGLDQRELVVSTSMNELNDVLVSVRDSGPGISPENVGCLFDPFYTTKPGGMGMGLSICRSIVEAHRGRLWAASDLAHGATFQFTLPVNGEPSS